MSPRSRWTKLSTRALALLFLGVAASASAAGCKMENALVGGACADGYALCNDACIDVRTDTSNCGGCASVCRAGEACNAGLCGSAGVASPPGVIVSPPVPAPVTAPGASGSVPGAAAPGDDGGSATSADAGTPADDAASIGTTSDAAVDGSSDSGAADSSSSSPPDGGGSDDAALACVAPLVSCEGSCSDLQSDPFNCGACGHFCPTYICQAGACVGTLPGQVVLIGHDYASSIPEATPQARVLVNTIFGSGSPTVRVLAYQEYAAPPSVANVAAILNGYAGATHRRIAITPSSDPRDIPASLDVTRFDALLVLDEPNAPAGALGSVGASWASTLAGYMSAGGTVVVLDGATAAEMPALVSGAGLFALSAQTPLPSAADVVNLAPGDSVGNGVESPYHPTQHSAFFAVRTDLPGITTVVFDPTDGAPVVVQRIVGG